VLQRKADIPMDLLAHFSGKVPPMKAVHCCSPTQIIRSQPDCATLVEAVEVADGIPCVAQCGGAFAASFHVNNKDCTPTPQMRATVCHSRFVSAEAAIKAATHKEALGTEQSATPPKCGSTMLGLVSPPPSKKTKSDGAEKAKLGNDNDSVDSVKQCLATCKKDGSIPDKELLEALYKMLD